MSDINFTAIQVPNPAPYDDKEPTQNQENVCFVLLQLFALAQQAGFTIPDKAGLQEVLSGVNISIEIAALDGIEQAIKDLKFNSLTFTIQNTKWRFDGRTLSQVTT